MPFKALPNLEIAPTGEDSTNEPRFFDFYKFSNETLISLRGAMSMCIPPPIEPPVV
jgi:hypothetical protein